MSNLIHDYEPRVQFIPFHQRIHRWACLVCHRRSGKTVACVNELITRALYSQKDSPRYAYVAPFYRQAKDVAWQYLKEFAAPFLAAPPRESELRVHLLNGAWITLYGADNPDALRGIYLDGIVLDEFGDCRPSLWGQVVLPTLADRQGWAVFIGTPKGRNHFYDTYQRAREEENWFALQLPASVSGILPRAELLEMRSQMMEEEYNQEIECDFEAAVRGTFYADMINDLERSGALITTSLFNPLHPVKMACDIGYKDSTAMWFWQERDDHIDVIDYYETNLAKLAEIFEHLRHLPYDYSHLWFPHDAKAETAQAEHSTIRQAQMWAARHYPDADVGIVPRLARQHGIDSVRQMLPHCRFSLPQTQDGLNALKAYRRKYDEVMKVFSKEPLHDWASDGADAFRYMSIVADRGSLSIPQEQKKEVHLLKTPEYKLKILFDERESLAGSRRYHRQRLH